MFMNVPIVCGVLELTKSKLKTNMLGFAAYVFDLFDVGKPETPYVKKQGLSNAQFRTKIASELCAQ